MSQVVRTDNFRKLKTNLHNESNTSYDPRGRDMVCLDHLFTQINNKSPIIKFVISIQDVAWLSKSLTIYRGGCYLSSSDMNRLSFSRPIGPRITTKCTVHRLHSSLQICNE